MSGVQSQALDSIKDKLNDSELALQHEKHARARLEVWAKLETLNNNNNMYFFYSAIPTASLFMALYSIIIKKENIKIKN